MLNHACRTGARLGSVEGTTKDQVKTHVTGALPTSVNATVLIKDAREYDTGTPPANGVEGLPSFSDPGTDMELSDLQPGQLFAVYAEVDYGAVALVKWPIIFDIFKDLDLTGHAFMRHE